MRAIPLAFMAGFGLLVVACATPSPYEEAHQQLVREAERECEVRLQIENPSNWQEAYMACVIKLYEEKMRGNPSLFLQPPSPPEVECPPGTYWMGSGCTSR